MVFDLAPLQAWYRGALRRRIDELSALRGPLDWGEQKACAAAREVGRALRGSGGSFGFPTITEVAELLETSADADVPRRLEGLVEVLWGAIDAGEVEPRVHAEWLIRSAGLVVDRTELGGFPDLGVAWAVVAERSGLDGSGLADRVRRRLGLPRTSGTAPDRMALRLLPEALMWDALVLPLREDSEHITVLAADPTSLSLELELRRTTGRIPVFGVAPPEVIESALGAAPSGRTEHPKVVPAMAPEQGLGTVLVVDDDEGVRTFMRRILERRGYGVLEAGDGIEGLEQVRRSSRPVVLALVDLEMPRMAGRDFLRALRHEDRGDRLPVIIVTGHEELLLEVDLIEDGADDYIRKPFDPRLLLARINATLRRAEA